MVTAFVDMVGLLMVVPLIPFYAREMGAGGLMVGVLVSAFSLAQLISAPLWGRFSDRYGRRPALLIGLGAAAAAYVVFAFADSLVLLLASRLVQGAGGGTVGVIQAYVADATEPKDRAKSLGWLSAATNLGVAIGPLLGSWTKMWGDAAPGLAAAALCAVNMGFAFFYLRESHTTAHGDGPRPTVVRPREVIGRVMSHPGEPAPRLIWIYAIGMGALHGMMAVLALFLADRFEVTETSIGYVFAWTGSISVLARAVILGRAVDRFGEARLSRAGQALLMTGLALIPLTWRLSGAVDLPGVGSVSLRFVALGACLALVPLGTAFTFPCVTALLSHVIAAGERGTYMGVQQSFGGAARVVFPLWAGFAYDALGPGYPFWTAALMVAATLFLAFGLEQHTRERAAPAAAGP